jgi:NADH dehydrogenase
VIAGGGPTGVEVAGIMAEMVRKIGPREYPEIPPGTFKIHLIQGSGELLKTMSKKAQDEALKVLSSMNINIILNRRVVDYADGNVLLDQGDPIPTNALIWTSGVIGKKVDGFPEETFGIGRRLIVDEHLLVKGTNNIFALGDISINTLQKEYPEGHPQLAQVAIQQGKYLARNLITSSDIKSWKAFLYKEKGTMAIISKYNAVADLPHFSFKGFGAWLAWLFIHLIPIAGFKNKFDLAISWAWAFITDNPTLRLIIRPQKESAFEKLEVESDGTSDQPSNSLSKQDTRPIKSKAATRVST